MAERGSGEALVVRALGAFHTLAPVVPMLIAAHRGGVLGDALGSIGTIGGLVLFAALWGSTAWTTGRALEGLTLARGAGRPLPRPVGAAAAWGSLNGVLFFFALVVVFVGRNVLLGVVDGVTGEYVGLLLYVMIGGVVASGVGAVIGLGMAAVDAVLLGAARGVAGACGGQGTSR